MSIVTKLNHADVNRLKQIQGVVLLDFYAQWCFWTALATGKSQPQDSGGPR